MHSVAGTQFEENVDHALYMRMKKAIDRMGGIALVEAGIEKVESLGKLPSDKTEEPEVNEPDESEEVKEVEE